MILCYALKKDMEEKSGCIAVIIGRLGWLIILTVLCAIKYIIWPEPVEPLRTDVDPLQRRLVLDGGISSVQWRSRWAYDNGSFIPVQDNYIVIAGLAEVPAAADMFATVGDARPVEVSFEGETFAAQESEVLLEQLNAQMQERCDEELKPSKLNRFAWVSQRNRVYIELECR